MCIPIIFFRQCLVDAIVKVFVVGEDDMTSHIVKLQDVSRDIMKVRSSTEKLTKPSGVISVDARPPGVSLESTIIHDGPSCRLGECCVDAVTIDLPYNLVQALCCTQSGRTSTNDQDIDRSGAD